MGLSGLPFRVGRPVSAVQLTFQSPAMPRCGSVASSNAARPLKQPGMSVDADLRDCTMQAATVTRASAYCQHEIMAGRDSRPRRPRYWYW
jgi:hypothetical protein